MFTRRAFHRCGTWVGPHAGDKKGRSPKRAARQELVMHALSTSACRAAPGGFRERRRRAAARPYGRRMYVDHRKAIILLDLHAGRGSRMRLKKADRGRGPSAINPLGMCMPRPVIHRAPTARRLASRRSAAACCHLPQRDAAATGTHSNHAAATRSSRPADFTETSPGAPARPLARPREPADYFSAIWIRLPHVSSKRASLAGPTFVGSIRKTTPSPAIRSYSP